MNKLYNVARICTDMLTNLKGSLAVGTTLSGFITPKMLHLMSINQQYGEYHCYVDGNEVCVVNNVTARGLTMFVLTCKRYSLTLQNKIHRVTFVVPYGDSENIKHAMYIHYIIPTVNGVPIVSNDIRQELGVYKNGYFINDISEVEKQLLSRVSGIVIRWGKEEDEGVIIHGE